MMGLFTKAVVACVVLAGIGIVQTKIENDNQIERNKVAAVKQAKQDKINTEYFKNNRLALIARLKADLANHKYSEVKVEAAKYGKANDPELKSIQAKAITELEKIRIKNRTALILKELKKIPSSEFKENRDRYKELIKLHPGNKIYQAKFEDYDGKYKIQMAMMAQLQKRKDDIKSQFSSWDGSHTALKNYVERNLNNPDSFEHVETKFSDKGDYIFVYMKYRATNGFNAVVTNGVSAKFSISGQMLEIKHL